MTTPSLIEWLREQLDTDERLARCPRERDWTVEPYEPSEPGAVPASSWVVSGEDGIAMCNGSYVADHIANWDPARVLAEVQSKRAILDVHPIETDLSEYERGLGTGQSFGCRRCADDDGVIKGEGYCRTLQALAEPYRSRPGFRKEWLDG